MASRVEQDWVSGTTYLPELDPPRMPGEPSSVRRLGRSIRWLIRPFLRLRWRYRVLVAIVTLVAVVFGWIYFGPASLAGHPPFQNAFLYDRTGAPLAELRPEENRVLVPISKVPKVVQDAFIAAEDSRFW